MSAPPTSLEFQDTALSVVIHDGRPWLSAQDVALALGYSQANAIHRLYTQRAAEFTGEIPVSSNR
jgi:prophage antirepressor-like protein